MFQTTEKLQLIDNKSIVNNENNLPIVRQSTGDEPSRSTIQTLDKLFPEQEREEKNIKKTKQILGQLSEQFNDQQLKDLIVETQFLTESWLDDFERSIFNGLTLQELFHEKGAL